MAQYKVIGRGEAGKPYGHVPGHTYVDMHVAISSCVTSHGMRYRVVATEVWGSAQGYDEEHGRDRVMATGMPSIAAAVAEVRRRATAAKMTLSYLASAVGEAEVDAEDSIERNVSYA